MLPDCDHRTALRGIHLILKLFVIAVRSGEGRAHFVAVVKRAHLTQRQRSQWRIARSPTQLLLALVDHDLELGRRGIQFFQPVSQRSRAFRWRRSQISSCDEPSARQARTQARELNTENRIRFPCLAERT